jgi:hypothetical protein
VGQVLEGDVGHSEQRAGGRTEEHALPGAQDPVAAGDRGGRRALSKDDTVHSIVINAASA